MKRAELILIQKNLSLPQLEPTLFLVVKRWNETILQEDGTQENKELISGFKIMRGPDGRFHTKDCTKYTFLTSDLVCLDSVWCDYVNLPVIARIDSSDETSQ